jgi:predicted transcriptional regulator
MARGLSPLQKDILRIFDQSHGALTTTDVMARLDLDFFRGSNHEINANSLRRALMRLWERGLVMRTAETSYIDGGHYSHFWAKPTESAIDRYCHYDPPYLVSDRCPLHATYGTVVYGRWDPAKETNRNALAAITGMPVRASN